MKAWAADQKINHASLLTFMGDPSSTLTKALGMELTHEGPASKGLFNRCKRNALHVVDGVVKHVVISEAAAGPEPLEFARGSHGFIGQIKKEQNPSV